MEILFHLNREPQTSKCKWGRALKLQSWKDLPTSKCRWWRAMKVLPYYRKPGYQDNRLEEWVKEMILGTKSIWFLWRLQINKKGFLIRERWKNFKKFKRSNTKLTNSDQILSRVKLTSFLVLMIVLMKIQRRKYKSSVKIMIKKM